VKISLNWVNEFVDLSGISIACIVSRFSLCTAEIEGYEVKKPLIEGAVVGEIKTCEPVAGSKKLSLLTVFDGKKNRQVVCGAPNVRVGLKVAWADVGKKVIAGVESHGMCLGADELGIGNDHSGIIELDAKAVVGTPIGEFLPFVNDTIIEIDNKSITNRPDLWGHYGVARELAVIFDRGLKPIKSGALPLASVVPVKIESDMCHAYGAVRVENVTRKVAPLEIITRLYYLDINSHGFLVDLSNYLMLEMGQPNHTFDAARVNKISIGSVKPHINHPIFTTLKDQEVKVTPDMLFIKSDGIPVALAGVIGGKNSEISADTKDCVWEFATFDATCVRKTAAAIGTRTDASARFEKSLDTNLCELTAKRMVYFLNKLDPKARIASSWSYQETKPTKSIDLKLDTAYVEKFCGVKFDWKVVLKKLTALGFAPKIAGGLLAVTAPTWRATKDVTLPVDVIEEIVRTYGYDKIVPMPPRVDVRPITQPGRKQMADRIKDVLAFVHRCQEVHTYIWSEKPSDLRVLNSAVKDCDFVRANMAASLLSVIGKCRGGMGGNAPRIFEIGQVVVDGKEQRSLCISVPSYQELANIVRDVFKCKFKIGGIIFPNDYIHPQNHATIIVNKQVVGGICVAVGYDQAIAEINLDKIDPETIIGNTKNFPAPSRFQKNTLDFTFEISPNIKDAKDIYYGHTYGYIEDVFEKFVHPLNMGFKLKDVYTGSGAVAYTVQFTVGSHERTLTATDINEILEKIIAHGKNYGLTLKQ